MELRILGLCKRYGDSRILIDLDLAIGAGDIVALVGRSGAGKSTLLNLVAGIELADSGRILAGGAELGALDEDARSLWRRRHLGLVFQFFNLVPSLKVEDNVSLPLELLGRPRREALARARELLGELGLAALAGRWPEALSGGEQQRVAVARALIHRPGLVLADEPTGSLDADNAARVLDLLIGRCRQAGASLLMASHAQEVLGRADRLLRLDAGRLVAA